jgi:hypothetical protein
MSLRNSNDERNNLLNYNIVKLSFNLNNMPYSIICIYMSPSSDYTGFLNSLRDVLNNLNLNAGIITLIGPFIRIRFY